MVDFITYMNDLIERNMTFRKNISSQIKLPPDFSKTRWTAFLKLCEYYSDNFNFIVNSFNSSKLTDCDRNQKIRLLLTKKEEIFSDSEKAIKPSEIQEMKTREEVDKEEEILRKENVNQKEKETSDSDANKK